MSAIKKYLLSMFLLLFSVSVISAQSKQAEMFEKAKYTMESKGDLQDAILQFEEIIKEYPDEKEYCAKSQFFIGLCYEKLGYQEAKKAYEKVIANYPSEEETVLLAKDKLAAFQYTAVKGVEVKKDFQLQQVWAEPHDNSGAPSPDGNLLSFVNWDGPCLAIYDLASGERKNIQSTMGEWAETSTWPEQSIWSPDGQKLAYVWYGEEHVSIRIVGIDASEPEEIYYGDKVKFCQPYAWSSDDTFILAVLCLGDNRHEIVSISPDDHSVTTLKELDGGSHPSCSLSPNDKIIAYSYTPELDSPQTDIFLLNIETGIENRLIDHPKSDFNPLWMPDGESVVFFSDRTGGVSAWSQKVINGKGDGEANLIKNLPRLIPMGITQKGDIFMTFQEGGNDIYTASIDPENGKIVSEPERIVESFIGWNAGASYSPDGKSLAYVSDRGFLDPFSNWGQQSLIIRDLESGKDKVLVPKLAILLAGPLSAPCWSPEGDEIVVSGNDQGGRRGVYIINLDDGSHISLLENMSFEGSEIIWSQTSAALYYRIHSTKEKNGLYRIDRKADTQSRILAGETIHELALHPNGKIIAFTGPMRSLKVFDTETEEVKVLHTLPEEIQHTTLAWSPDGKWLYYMKCYGDNKDVELWRMSPEGENHQLIGDSLPHFKFLAFHPDGKRIVFTAGKMSGSSSTWVMKNFMTE